MDHKAEPPKQQEPPKTTPAPATTPTQAPNGYRIKLSARNLDKKGVFNKGDPFLLITGTNPQNKPVLLYRSEVAAQTVTPLWTPFDLETSLCGGLDAPLLIECFDFCEDGNHELVGNFKVTLREMAMPHAIYPLINPEKKGGLLYKNSGQVAIEHCDPVVIPPITHKGYSFKLRAQDLDNKAALGMGKSSPFLVMKGIPLPSASAPPTPVDGLFPRTSPLESVVLHRTEVLRKEDNPIWHQFQLDIDMCGGLDKMLHIEVLHWDDNGVTQFIGSCSATLRELTFPNPKFVLLNAEKKGRIGYKHSGILHIMSCKPEDKPVALPACDFEFKMSARDLDRHDLNGKSDPYVLVFAKPLAYVSLPYVLPEQLANLPQPPAPVPATTQPAQQQTAQPAQTATQQTTQTTQQQQQPAQQPATQPAQQQTAQPAQTATQQQQKTTTPAPATNQPATNAPAQQTAQPQQQQIRETKDYKPKDEGRVLIYKTEIILKNLNPDYLTFHLDLFTCGGMDGVLEFRCYDFDNDGHDDYIGSFKTSLRELLTQVPSYRLVNEKKEGGSFYNNSGLFNFVVKPIASPTFAEFMEWPRPKEYNMHIRCENLERKDLLGLGKSDGYLQITGLPYADKKKAVIFRSETIKSNSNPEWKPFKLDVTVTGGLDAPLYVEVLDDDNDDKPDFIGSFTTSLRELSCYKTNPKYFLINKNKEGGFFYSYSGILTVLHCDAIQPPKPVKVEPPKPAPVPQPQPQPQQPYPYYPNQPNPGQQFTISVSSGPSGFNISLGHNTSQIIEPQPQPYYNPNQPAYPPGIQPLQPMPVYPQQPMQQQPGYPPGVQPPAYPQQQHPQQPPQQPPQQQMQQQPQPQQPQQPPQQQHH